MRLTQFRVPLAKILGLFSFGLLLLLLWSRLDSSLMRYFDADELAYLHWAHNVFSGHLPYRDFLLYAPPGFLYVLAPMYAFVEGQVVLFVGRTVAFVLYVMTAGAMSYLFWQVRKSWVAVLAAALFVFLPLPQDKLMEIRPDTLAVLLALLGLICEIDAIRLPRRYWMFTLSGLLYGASLLVLQKTLPQVVVSSVVLFAWMFLGEESVWHRKRAFISFVAGGVISFGMFVFWVAFVFRDWTVVDTVVYSLTKLPFEVNRIGEVFGMQADLFFYPNTVYYGLPGWSVGLVANHICWFIGLMAGSIRFVSPFVAHGKKGVWQEMLIAGTWLSYILSFLYGYPLRHAQYLIPIAVFVAFYAADVVLVAWNYLNQRQEGRFVFILGFAALCIGIWNVNGQINMPKLMLTNDEDVRILNRAIAMIPKGAYVLDLVGSTIYFADPYYVCCVPFGQWEPYLSRPLPDLPSTLERTHTRYIYQGRLGRVSTLSAANQAYIRAHYRSESADNSLLVRID